MNDYDYLTPYTESKSHLAADYWLKKSDSTTSLSTMQAQRVFHLPHIHKLVIFVAL